MELKSLLDQPHKLPMIPRVTQQLIHSFGAESASVGEIAAQIAADPGLSAKLLRLANSAYFHFSRTIGTVDDALRMLGFVMVRNLVLGNGMAAAFRQTPGIDLKQFWRYNLHTACTARWLALRDGAAADLVFTVGLLHGIGQLHLHVVAAAAMAPIDRQTHVLAPGRAAREQQLLGFHHGDVAAGLAAAWNFPAPIVAALRDVPEPLAAAEFSDAAAWVHLAAWRARAEALALDEQAMDDSYPGEVGQRLRLQPDWRTTVPAFEALTAGLEAMLD